MRRVRPGAAHRVHCTAAATGIAAMDARRRVGESGTAARAYGTGVVRPARDPRAASTHALLHTEAETDFAREEEESVGVVRQLGCRVAPVPAAVARGRPVDPQKAMWDRFDEELAELRRIAESLAAPHRSRGPHG